MSTESRFILFCLPGVRSEEFPGEAEAEIEAVRDATTGELAESRPLPLVEIELKQVAAYTLLHAEPVGRLVRTVAAGTRSDFSDDGHLGAHSHATADGHEERVAIDVQDSGWQT